MLWILHFVTGKDKQNVGSKDWKPLLHLLMDVYCFPDNGIVLLDLASSFLRVISQKYSIDLYETFRKCLLLCKNVYYMTEHCRLKFETFQYTSGGAAPIESSFSS